MNRDRIVTIIVDELASALLREGTSAHEAGHAVVSRAAGLNVTRVHRIRTHVHEIATGETTVVNGECHWRGSVPLSSRLTVMAAGLAGDELANGGLPVAPVNLVPMRGTGSDFPRFKALSGITDVVEARAMFRRYVDRAKAIIAEHRDTFERVRDALSEKSEVDGAELRRVLDGPAPRRVHRVLV